MGVIKPLKVSFSALRLILFFEKKRNSKIVDKINPGMEKK
jgi:hypothetical protein